MRIINVDMILILLGVIALIKGDCLLAITILYIAFAHPTQIVSEVEKKVNGWLYLIGKEAENVNKNKRNIENRKG